MKNTENISQVLCQYNGYWCPGSWCRQVISSHTTDSIRSVACCLQLGRISTICIISMLSQKIDINSIFPHKNSAHKGLNLSSARWRHQMETFSVLLAICAGNSPVPSEFPTQRPVTRSLMFSLICIWINVWVNNREAGDLSRYRTHYDITIMSTNLRQLSQ